MSCCYSFDDESTTSSDRKDDIYALLGCLTSDEDEKNIDLVLQVIESKTDAPPAKIIKLKA